MAVGVLHCGRKSGVRGRATIVGMTDDTPFRLLSFNIQVGMQTQDYRHYVTGAWRHALPNRRRRDTLLEVAELIRDYDFVAIQEADAGSLRTDHVNLIEFLAEHAGFRHCGLTVTRDMAPFARFCLGYLSRAEPSQVITHSLPGRLPGRGAVEVTLDDDRLGALTLMVTHLALGQGARKRQLAYLSRIMAGRQGVLVGDLNTSPARVGKIPELLAAGLQPLPWSPATYPSWRPTRSLDQVLLTTGLQAVSARTLPVILSDHLPLEVELAPAA